MTRCTKISFKEIKPTKTNLLNLQKKLNFTVKGRNFLEFKREQLIVHIKNLWNDYLSVRKEFLLTFRMSMIKLNEAYKESGVRNLKLISEISKVQYTPLVNIKYKKIVGNITPIIEYEIEQAGKLPAYSFEKTSQHLDDLINNYLKYTFEKLIYLAEKEDTMLRFSLSFKNLNRRINGLKNVIIPELQEKTKKIKGVLEESDRESFVRLKKTKDLIIYKP